MNAHTPGPWRIGDDPADIVADDDVVVATINDRSLTMPGAERAANAQLIAAAPELLRVARIEHELQMSGYTRATAKRLGADAEDAYLSGGVPGLNDWRRQQREAAIAKAEGR